MSNRPEDFPSTPDLPSAPITREFHSGMKNVPEDAAERVDNPNFEFDTPLIKQAKDLPTPEDLGYTANVRGVDHPVVTPEEQEALAARVAASRAPEKKKWSLGTKLTVLGVSALAAVGIGISANAAAEGPFMKAPTATAPPVPGQGEKTPSANQSEASLPSATATNTNETVTYVPVTEADVKGYDQLVEKSKITRAEVSDGNNVLPSLVDRINEIINVTLTDDEIAASKNMISETGKVGPEALAEMKRSALGSSFGDKNSNFYKGFLKEGEENFRYWMATRNEAEPYKAEFVPTDTYGEYAYKTNVNKNSLEDSADASVFKFVSIYAELRIPKGSKAADGNWVVTGQPKIVKTGETVPNS